VKGGLSRTYSNEKKKKSRQASEHDPDKLQNQKTQEKPRG